MIVQNPGHSQLSTHHAFHLKEDEYNPKAIVKSTFIEVFSDSHLHGIPNMIKTENVIMKFFWLALFLCGVGCCIYCGF